MTKAKKLAPKAEPKAKATVQNKKGIHASIKKAEEVTEREDKEIANSAKEKSATAILVETEGMAKNGMSIKDMVRLWGTKPTRFNTGDVIKHEGRLYQCISANGHHDAILAAYSHQNNRADHSKVMTVSNDPSVEDGFIFSKY